MPITFLELPPEIRVEVYHHLVQYEPYWSPQQIIVKCWEAAGSPDVRIPQRALLFPIRDEPGEHSPRPLSSFQPKVPAGGPPKSPVEGRAGWSSQPLQSETWRTDLERARTWFTFLDDECQSYLCSRFKLQPNPFIEPWLRAYHIAPIPVNLPALSHSLHFRLTCKQIRREFTNVVDNMSLPYACLGDFYNALLCMGETRRNELTQAHVIYRHEERSPFDSYGFDALHNVQKAFKLLRRCKNFRRLTIYLSEPHLKWILKFGRGPSNNNAVPFLDDWHFLRATPLKSVWGWTQLEKLKGLDRFEIVNLRPQQPWSSQFQRDYASMKTKMERKRNIDMTDEDIRRYRQDFDAWWRGDHGTPEKRRRSSSIQTMTYASQIKLKQRQQELRQRIRGEDPIEKIRRLERSSGLSVAAINKMVTDHTAEEILGPRRLDFYRALVDDLGMALLKRAGEIHNQAFAITERACATRLRDSGALEEYSQNTDALRAEFQEWDYMTSVVVEIERDERDMFEELKQGILVQLDIAVS